jgi:hypothetical protein
VIINKELKVLNFKETPNLDTSNGLFAVNIATWLQVKHPQQVTHGKLYLKYFAGMGYKTIELDALTPPVTQTALLSTKVKLPIELKGQSFTLCAEVTGSEFRVDTLYVEPQRKAVDNTVNKPLYAA